MKFRYEALREDGRPARGEIEADSVRTGQRALLRMGLRPVALDPARSRAARRARTVRAIDMMGLLRALAVLVQGGIPLADALAAIQDGTDHAGIETACGDAVAGLRRGESVAACLGRSFPRLAGPILTLIEAGELSGRLGDALADAATQLEEERKLRANLRNATFYPAFLTVFGFCAVLFIFTVLVPRFAVLFQGKLDRLPALSYAVIVGGLWMRGHAAIVLAGLGGLAGLAITLLRLPETRLRLYVVTSSLPWLGARLIELETARWTAILARLLENRIPLMQALDLAASVLRLPSLQVKAARIERELRAGTAFSTALARTGLLSSTALTLIRAGEQSGALPDMTRRVAAMFAETIRNRLRFLVAIAEPVSIILIGAAVGTVAVAVFLAITSVNDLAGT